MECKKCNNQIDDSKKFCSRSCAVSYNNKNRVLTDYTKAKISASLKPCISQSMIDGITRDFREGATKSELKKKYNCGRIIINTVLDAAGVKHKKQNSDVCEKHNLEYKRYPSGKRYCSVCASESTVNFRRKLKVKAVEYKGGQCEDCGYSKCIAALEFHHMDPNEKDFEINSITKSWVKIKQELNKCKLLCSNCHREEHDRLRGNN